LVVLDGCEPQPPARHAADLLALVAGPKARHGYKSRNRRLDGHKAHLSVDPDSELIDADDKPTIIGDSHGRAVPTRPPWHDHASRPHHHFGTVLGWRRDRGCAYWVVTGSSRTSIVGCGPGVSSR
jgi:hypothetical protein